mmetsp:Transcript_27447/g.53541  ORF Transcript_27447/g.53541 Transcript_27447/m.53541 type:complete len:475 (-) Transcript_27447:83-1507(-)
MFGFLGVFTARRNTPHPSTHGGAMQRPDSDCVLQRVLDGLGAAARRIISEMLKLNQEVDEKAMVAAAERGMLEAMTKGTERQAGIGQGGGDGGVEESTTGGRARRQLAAPVSERPAKQRKQKQAQKEKPPLGELQTLDMHIRYQRHCLCKFHLGVPSCMWGLRPCMDKEQRRGKAALRASKGKMRAVDVLSEKVLGDAPWFGYTLHKAFGQYELPDGIVKNPGAPHGRIDPSLPKVVYVETNGAIMKAIRMHNKMMVGWEMGDAVEAFFKLLDEDATAAKEGVALPRLLTCAVGNCIFMVRHGHRGPDQFEHDAWRNTEEGFVVRRPTGEKGGEKVSFVVSVVTHVKLMRAHEMASAFSPGAFEEGGPRCGAFGAVAVPGTWREGCSTHLKASVGEMMAGCNMRRPYFMGFPIAEEMTKVLEDGGWQALSEVWQEGLSAWASDGPRRWNAKERVVERKEPGKGRGNPRRWKQDQ